ncbi:hypothetical protein OCU04_013014 [Sclerotinia nivalis]|uniref:Uncharacterized protein n=1 Tax=Sclerotinia nivalis TaxID=352851 RepID=A0A9X0A8F6_9HELO|nr:hypothetical protein OCU04_013014 [Sclerotinia nivalis]
MKIQLVTLTSLLALAIAFPTTKTRASLIQGYEKGDLGKSCKAGFIRGVAAIGVCTSTIINVENGLFACSVATSSTATSPVPSHSVYGDLVTDKGKYLEDLRMIVERAIPVF